MTSASSIPSIQPAAVSADAKTKDGLTASEAVVPALVPPHDAAERVYRAQEDAQRQAGMSVKSALSTYKWAVIWSALMTCTQVMEAYDYQLMGSLFGFPAFAKQYGDLLPNGTYNINAGTQSLLKQITKVGQVIGLLITGWMVDKFGYKWTMILSLLAIIPPVFMQFFAPNVGVLIGAQLLLGIPLGPFTTLSNVYAAEVAPLALQPYLTSATSLGSNVGYLLSQGVLRGLLNSSIERPQRVAFAIQWAWLLPMGIIVFLAPESPIWCVKTGRIERARASLKRLSGSGETEDEIENRLALLEYTNHVEKEMSAESSYLEVFKGINLRRTEIVAMVYMCQNLDGYDIGNSSTYFFQRAGLNAAHAFDITLGNYSLSIVTCMMTWFIIRRIGRRPLFNFGLFASVLILIAIGGLGIPKPSTATGWATGGFGYLYNVIFHFTQGPLCYSYITDIPSTRLRNKTIVVGRIAFICSAVFMVVLTNYQINATAWNWRGKAGFFWAGSCLLCFVWAYYRLPETKDRSPVELDRLFMDKVPARKFRTTKVEAVEMRDIEQTKLDGQTV